MCVCVCVCVCVFGQGCWLIALPSRLLKCLLPFLLPHMFMQPLAILFFLFFDGRSELLLLWLALQPASASRVHVGPEEIMDFRDICFMAWAITVGNRTTQKGWDTVGYTGHKNWDAVRYMEERFGMHKMQNKKFWGYALTIRWSTATHVLLDTPERRWQFRFLALGCALWKCAPKPWLSKGGGGQPPAGTYSVDGCVGTHTAAAVRFDNVWLHDAHFSNNADNKLPLPKQKGVLNDVGEADALH